MLICCRSIVLQDCPFAIAHGQNGRSYNTQSAVFGQATRNSLVTIVHSHIMHAANHSTIAHHALRRSSVRQSCNRQSYTLIYSYAFDNHTSSIKQLVPAGGVWCGHRPRRDGHRRRSSGGGHGVHQGLHIYVQQRHSPRRHLREVIKGIMNTYYGTSTCIRLVQSD
jgi:hypothetical protein